MANGSPRLLLILVLEAGTDPYVRHFRNSSEFQQLASLASGEKDGINDVPQGAGQFRLRSSRECSVLRPTIPSRSVSPGSCLDLRSDSRSSGITTSRRALILTTMRSSTRFRPRVELGSENKYEAGIESTLVSDVPVCAFACGSFDSNLISAKVVGLTPISAAKYG